MNRLQHEDNGYRNEDQVIRAWVEEAGPYLELEQASSTMSTRARRRRHAGVDDTRRDAHGHR